MNGRRRRCFHFGKRAIQPSITSPATADAARRGEARAGQRNARTRGAAGTAAHSAACCKGVATRCNTKGGAPAQGGRGNGVPLSNNTLRNSALFGAAAQLLRSRCSLCARGTPGCASRRPPAGGAALDQPGGVGAAVQRAARAAAISRHGGWMWPNTRRSVSLQLVASLQELLHRLELGRATFVVGGAQRPDAIHLRPVGAAGQSSVDALIQTSGRGRD